MTLVKFVYDIFHFIPNNDVIKKFSLHELYYANQSIISEFIKSDRLNFMKSLSSQSAGEWKKRKQSKLFKNWRKMKKKKKTSFSLMNFDIIDVYMLQNECIALTYMCSIWIMFCRTSKQFNAHRRFEKCTFFTNRSS